MKHNVKVQFNDKFLATSILKQNIYRSIVNATEGTCEIEFDTHYPTKYKSLATGITHDLKSKVSHLFTEDELASFAHITTGTISPVKLLEFVCKHYKTNIPELQNLANKRAKLEEEIAKLEKEINDLKL